jgi:hypothetical protein
MRRSVAGTSPYQVRISCMKGDEVEFIPSEYAVLRQIRDLYRETRNGTFLLTVLTSRWPPLHYEAYATGLLGLISKGAIANGQDGRSVRITNAGMKLVGLRAA